MATATPHISYRFNDFSKLNELKELRYELEINDKFFNTIETEANRWHVNIKFHGNKKGV